MRVALIALLSLLLLAGCKEKPRIHVVSKEIKPLLHVQDPEELRLGDIKWYVITERNFQQTVDRLRAEGTKPYFFAITEDGYRELRSNDAKIMKYIRQQRAVIIAYRRYYDGSGNVLESLSRHGQKKKHKK